MDLIRKFVEQVIEKSDYTELDKYYLYNHVLHLVGKCEKECQEASIIDVKDALVEQAVLNQKIDDLSSSKDSLGCELMDLITPIPSVLNQRFNEMYAQDKKRAIADFYELSKSNDYVKTKAIAKNIYFKTPTDYGNLEITINLSKPEKDPKQIALAKNSRRQDILCVSYAWKMKGIMVALIILQGRITESFDSIWVKKSGVFSILRTLILTSTAFSLTASMSRW